MSEHDAPLTAILLLAEAWAGMDEPTRRRKQPTLWANPIICTPDLFERAKTQAEEDGSAYLVHSLDDMKRLGLITTSVDPRRTSRDFSAPQAYVNRQAKRKGKDTPSKPRRFGA